MTAPTQSIQELREELGRCMSPQQCHALASKMLDRLESSNARITELEADQRKLQLKYDSALADVARNSELESTQKPMPMAAAPRDGTMVRVVADLSYNALNGVWINSDGHVVNPVGEDGWLPLPDQSGGGPNG